jgi:hypothetical protein
MSMFLLLPFDLVGADFTEWLRRTPEAHEFLRRPEFALEPSVRIFGSSESDREIERVAGYACDGDSDGGEAD